MPREFKRSDRVADALQLGTDFAPSDHGKANGDAFLSHLDQS